MNALGNILVVDDNPDWRNKLKAILEEDGFYVWTAEGRQEAVGVLLEQPLHVAVIDLKLNAADLSKDEGFTLLEEVQRLGLNDMIYSIMLTGYATTEGTRRAFKQYGVIDFFEKSKFKAQRERFQQAVREAMIKAKYGQLRKLGFKCFKTGGECNCKIQFEPRQVFVAIPYRSKLIVMDDVYELGIKAALQELNYEPLRADEKPVLGRDLMCNICRFIQESVFGIVDITDWNPNVLLELGMMFGWGRTAVIIKHEKSKVPSDLRGALYVEYASVSSLKDKLISGLPNLEL